MGAQRIKNHELTIEDINRMREEEGQLTLEGLQDLGDKEIVFLEEL